MKSETIQPILTRLGFFTNFVSDDWHALEFDYEGINLLFMPDDDEHCIIITVPNIFGVDDENRSLVYDKLNELSNSLKYIKPSVMYGDSVWLAYEHYLPGDQQPDEKLLEHIVRLLAAGFHRFHGLINADDSDDDTAEETESETETDEENGDE